MVKSEEIIDNYKNFIEDLHIMEYDAHKIRETINEVSPNDSIKGIMDVLSKIIEIEKKIKKEYI